MGFDYDQRHHKWVHVFFSLELFIFLGIVSSSEVQNQSAYLMVDARDEYRRQIPKTLFGIFFEEINHAGAGGLWAELVSNRDFEAGGSSTPSYIQPWSIIGNESSIVVSTDHSSCFIRNNVALRMVVLCDIMGPSTCPEGGVGVYNPGYWGMNIEQGKDYRLVFYVRSLGPLNISVSLTSSDGSVSLATSNIVCRKTGVAVRNWRRTELLLTSQETDHKARLSLTTMHKAVIWIDQVSLIPVDTFKGHGFRKDLMAVLLDLKPQFVRFPGGCFVEGVWMRNAFRWMDTVGPWEERPGHFGDVWGYWTDDGLGYFELLQLAEDLNASPIWVVNIGKRHFLDPNLHDVSFLLKIRGCLHRSGISHREQVETSGILPFVQDVLDSIEFARGDSTSKWGLVQAAMGHPEPFQLSYVSLGNEDCNKPYYTRNYMKFYYAIKGAYPDIKIISNCDGSSRKLDHPADVYDFHTYDSANNIFSMAHKFDNTSREGPKVFVSEYAVHGADAHEGTFLAGLAKAGFLVGLERNSDIVELASYAPLFVNYNNRRWESDAIVFNSWQNYRTPSYWAQTFFKESNGAFLHPADIHGNSTSHLIVNFDPSNLHLKINVTGLDSMSMNSSGSYKTTMTADNLMDENSFSNQNMVRPLQSMLQDVGPDMDVVLSAFSVTAFDLALVPGLGMVTKAPFVKFEDQVVRRVGIIPILVSLEEIIQRLARVSSVWGEPLRGLMSRLVVQKNLDNDLRSFAEVNE